MCLCFCASRVRSCPSDRTFLPSLTANTLLIFSDLPVLLHVCPISSSFAGYQQTCIISSKIFSSLSPSSSPQAHQQLQLPVYSFHLLASSSSNSRLLPHGIPAYNHSLTFLNLNHCSRNCLRARQANRVCRRGTSRSLTLCHSPHDADCLSGASRGRKQRVHIPDVVSIGGGHYK